MWAILFIHLETHYNHTLPPMLRMSSLAVSTAKKTGSCKRILEMFWMEGPGNCGIYRHRVGLVMGKWVALRKLSLRNLYLCVMHKGKTLFIPDGFSLTFLKEKYFINLSQMIMKLNEQIKTQEIWRWEDNIFIFILFYFIHLGWKFT